MSIAFLFPGQGSQAVGMGQALAQAHPEAARVFEEVDEALGEKLSDIMWQGPPEALTLTANTQPALMAVSVAAARVLETKGEFKLSEKASFVAGHSLGEYSALAAIGALPVAEVARLLRIRGNAMQAAVPAGQGAMAAILGLEMDQVETIAADASAEGEPVEVANDNAPGQIVLSGAKPAVERAIDAAKAAGAKRGLLLPVSAPFHCSLMQPAADAMAEALSSVSFGALEVPVVANVLAQANSDAGKVSDLLIQQVCGRVRWRESIAWMSGQGVETLVELGSGKVLTGLNKRIDKGLSSASMEKPEDLDAVLAALV